MLRILLLTASIATVTAILGWLFPALGSISMTCVDVPARGVEQTEYQTADEILHFPDLERYSDAAYGFSVGIPVGWSRIVSAESHSDVPVDNAAWVEPGYAVGFESPRTGPQDRFADYLLIEILPGEETGLFSSTAENRRQMQAYEAVISYDRLTIDAESDDSTDVDLVIFQHGVQALGYTLGFYAIGEPANEQALLTAFQLMLLTFTQNADPFVII